MTLNANGTIYEYTSSKDGIGETLTDNVYNIPVYGLDNGTFYYLHSTSIVCIISSFVCAIVTLVLSFRRQNVELFYKTWTTSDRFVVYIAVCDACSNVFCLLDHSQMMITQDHIRPPELCEFYGFTLMLFITVLILLVNVVAVNAFMLMYFEIKLDFGRNDWRLLLWTFGFPFAGFVVAAVTKQFVPAGFYCGLRGHIVLWLYTVPLLVILMVNTVLYILTWRRIRQRMRTISTKVRTCKVSSRAARSMSLFVAAFFIQWVPLGVYSIWDLFTTEVSFPIVSILTVTTNTGGCLNLGVYVLIRRLRMSSTNSFVNPEVSKSDDGIL